MRMDDHARRVTAGVRRALDEYRADEATVADIQSAASGAAGALDNSNGTLRQALDQLDADLELVRFATPAADERSAVEAATTALRRLLD